MENILHISHSHSIAIFSKALTKTDVANPLSIPTKSLKHLPDFEGKRVVDIQVKDENGYFWTFECSIRHKGKYPKPVLSAKHWLPFVRFKKLNVSDRIVFYKRHDQATGAHYKIEVQRAVQVFGVLLG